MENEPKAARLSEPNKGIVQSFKDYLRKQKKDKAKDDAKEAENQGAIIDIK